MGFVAFYLADSRGKLAQATCPIKTSDEFLPADSCLEKSEKLLRALRRFLPLLVSKM